MGRPFAAILRIVKDEDNNNYKLEFDFGQGAGADDEAGEAIDFSGQTAVGACPKCGAQVFEHGMTYVCEKTPLKQCDFRSGKVILQQEIAREQMEKLLTVGRTDLLQGFVSNRNGRKFKAFLVRNPDGKIGFEFESKTGAGKTAATKAAAPKASSAKAASTKATAKKAAPKPKAARKTGAGLQPSAALVAVVGNAPLARTEVIKKLWDYIKAHGLQDANNKRAINADAVLRPIFGKDQVTMFELAGIVGKHLS
jgi:DNA topoisomerase-3